MPGGTPLKDVFFVGQRSPGRFALGGRALLDPSSDGFALVGYRYTSAAEAQQAAEQRVAQLLRELDLVPRAAPVTRTPRAVPGRR